MHEGVCVRMGRGDDLVRGMCMPMIPSVGHMHSVTDSTT